MPDKWQMTVLQMCNMQSNLLSPWFIQLQEKLEKILMEVEEAVFAVLRNCFIIPAACI